MPPFRLVPLGESKPRQFVERCRSLRHIKLGMNRDFGLRVFAILERDQACGLRLGQDQIAIFERHAHLR
jgi:hypothetical protein